MNPISRIRALLGSIERLATRFDRHAQRAEREMLLLGRLLSEQVRAKTRIASLREVEFSVFSQFGDDGIIQWLVAHVDLPHRTFVEFGVETYSESNTRFLMMNDNWSGFVMDGSASNVEAIVGSDYYWRHDLQAKAAFVDRDNVNEHLSGARFGREVGILHIDIDGNDYWVWAAVDAITPVIVILEYNSVFGIERAITVPYDAKFQRTRAHHSNLYSGASLPALDRLSREKGYAFIGCNSAGNNAYFVRKDKLNSVVSESALEAGYVVSRFRESRDRAGNLTFLAGDDRIAAIRGLPVYNVATGGIEPL